MTENTPAGDPAAVQQALHQLAADNEDVVALGTLLDQVIAWSSALAPLRETAAAA